MKPGIASCLPAGSPGQEIATALEEQVQVPPLLAGDPVDPEMSARLLGTNGAALLAPLAVNDRALAEGVRSGLLLWNEDFEASHQVAQDIENVSGAYWHGICHRREGHRGAGLKSNMDNARYWFRRVNRHPIFEGLYQEALALCTETFEGLSDEEIVDYAQRTGSTRAVEHLMSNHREWIETKARSYYLRGADPEDIIQEGLIGLFKAIRDYHPDRQSRFKTFAEVCVSRQIIIAVRAATRQEHIPRPSSEPDKQDQNEWFNEGRSNLSELEQKVVTDHMNGKPVQEVAGGPLLDRLRARDSWDPFLFVDLCQECEQGDAGMRPMLEAIQAAEMRILLDYCARGAIDAPR